MQRLRMVPVVRVSNGFEARVLAARLGSEGVIVELRGNGIDVVWPRGGVEVLVAESDLALARELLLLDEVEEAMEAGLGAESAEVPGGRVLPWWVVAVAVVLLTAFALAETLGRVSL